MKHYEDAERKKAVCPGLKGRDEFIAGVEEEEVLSNDARHENLGRREYLQPNVAEDLERLLTQAKDKFAEKAEEMGDYLSQSCEIVRDKVTPYLETVGEEGERFVGRIRHLWDRFTGQS